ncbi:MAG: hypothetical protein AMK72_02070 [Planctomycetes bacterium SM23_25]|nr:MAG: hypothetical protein AMK72_02070 [Planctomycetes bacterium SM23_25]
MTRTLDAALPTTGIGSLPLTDAEEAASFVLEADLTIPFWPQLPNRYFLEQMIPQYSGGMPCVLPVPSDGKVVLEPAAQYRELEKFYEKYLSEEPGAFAVAQEAAAGLYAFERSAAGRTWPVVKGQVTGPVTFCTGISGPDKKPLYADEELRDAAAKLLCRKAQWQVDRLGSLASKAVMIFVDEPVLAAYGSSAYLGISAGDVHELVGEVLEGIHSAGGITGIHVCGNSDWGMVLRTGVQVLNFDAYQFGTRLALYPEAVQALLQRGGYVAWGIVPTTPAVEKETPDSLARRFDGCIDALADKGLSRELLLDHSMITPSCGAGSLSPKAAGRVFELLGQLRERLLGAASSQAQSRQRRR